MKTTEEILESHLTSMLSMAEGSYVTIDEMKQVPEWEACVKAIEHAQKEAYNKAIDQALKLMYDHEEEIYIGVFEDIERLKK
jgi:hypothetical protein